MAGTSVLVSLRDSLDREEDVIETLQSLNTLLESSRTEEGVLEIGSVVTPRLLFEFLTVDRSREEMDLVCAILDKLMLAIPSEQLRTMALYVELGLQHSYVGVRKLSLRLLRKRITNDEVIREIVIQPTMFHLVTNMVGDCNLECAKYSTEILIELVRHPVSFSAVASTLWDGLVIDLSGLSNTSDIVRFRVHELVVSLALLGAEPFDLVARKCGLLDKLIEELKSNDALVKLNCLELLLSLMQSDEGMTLLVEANVLQNLHDSLVEVEHDPLASVLIPGMIKFFGHYCQRHGVDILAVCSQYPAFPFTTLSAVHHPEDDTVWNIAMDTVGLLCTSVDGRVALNSNQTQFESTLRKMGELVWAPKAEYCARSLLVLAHIFSCQETESKPSGLTNEDFFRLASPDLLVRILSIIKQPFAELHLAGLELLLSLSRSEWSQKKMQCVPGLVEYLFDRRTENDRKGKELKFEIIRALSVSPSAESVFGSPNLVKFKTYVLEGPFHVEGETSVAVEEM